MPFDLLDALGIAADATSIPDLKKRRERIGCFMGLIVVAVVGLILFAVSWI
jgi:hypothetical protein